MAKSYLKGLSGEGAKKGAKKKANYGSNKGAQTQSRKNEGRTRKQEAKKQTARAEAKNYPRDPGARAQLEGKDRRRAERENRRASGKGDSVKFTQGQKEKAFLQLLQGKRRFKTQQERAIDNQTVVPYAPKKPSEDIRDTTKRAERPRLPIEKDGALEKILKSVGKEAWKLSEGARTVTNIPMKLIENTVINTAKDAVTGPDPRDAKLKKANILPIDPLKNAQKALGKVAKDTATIADYTARPSYAIAAGTGAALKDEDVLKGLEKGITGKDRGGFAKVLREQGVLGKKGKSNSTAQNVGGLALDIALDPTTYLSLGAAPVAKVASQKAAAQAYKMVAKEGLEAAAKKLGVAGAKSADDLAEQVERKVFKEVTEEFGRKKGIQVGLNRKGRAGIKTSGRATATVNKLSGKLPTKVRESKPVQFLGTALAHDWRLPSVLPEEHTAARQAVMKAKGIKSKGYARSERLKVGADKAGLGADNIVYDFERGADFPGSRGMEKYFEEDFARKLRAGLLEHPWEKGRPSAAMQKDIAKLHKKAADEFKENALKYGLLAKDQRVSLAKARDIITPLASKGRTAGEGVAAAGSKAGTDIEPSNVYDDLLRYLDIMDTAAKAQGKGPGTMYVDEFDHPAVLQAFQNLIDPYRISNLIAKAERYKYDRMGAMTIGKGQGETWMKAIPRMREWARDSGAGDLADYLKEIERLQKYAPERYIKHVQNQNIKPIEDVMEFKGFGGPTTATKEWEREMMMSLENMAKHGQQAPGSPHAFSTNAPEILAHTERQTSTNEALGQLWGDIVDQTGRRVKRGEDLSVTLKPEEAVFRMAKDEPGRLGSPVGPNDIQELARISALNDVTEYVVLNRELVDQTRRAMSPLFVRRWDKAKAIEKFSGNLKSLYTKWNIPSFHVVNQIGDTAFASQANTRFFRGVGRTAKVMNAITTRNKYERSGAMFLDEPVPEVLSKPMKVGDIEKPMSEWIDEMEEFNVLTQGQVGHEIPEMTGHSVDSFTNRLFAHRENTMRIATYLEARARGLTKGAAAEHTAKHHIDYSDLTGLEQTLRALPVPFISFLARNTRIQVGQLFQRPGKLANLMKTLNAAARESGYESYMDMYDELKPYQQTMVLLPIGKGREPLNLNLPQALGLWPLSGDVKKAFKVGMGGLFMPFKYALEVGMNKQSFNDRQIKEDLPYNQGKKDGGKVPAPSWLKMFGIGETYRPDGGKEAPIHGIDAYLDYTLKQSPQTGALMKLGKPADKGGKDWIDLLTDQLGLKTQALPDSTAKAQEVNYAEGLRLANEARKAETKFGHDSPQAKAARRAFYQQSKTYNKKEPSKPTTYKGAYGNLGQKYRDAYR